MIEDLPQNTPINQGHLVTSLEFPALETSVPALCLTPECDFEVREGGKRKATYVLFCPLIEETAFFKNLFSQQYDIDIPSGINGLSGKKKDTVNEVTLRIVGDAMPRYYWIWNHITEKGLVADLQLGLSIKYEEASRLVSKYILVSSYKEAVASKFSAYMGRIGTIDLNFKSHRDRIVSTL